MAYDIDERRGDGGASDRDDVGIHGVIAFPIICQLGNFNLLIWSTF